MAKRWDMDQVWICSGSGKETKPPLFSMKIQWKTAHFRCANGRESPGRNFIMAAGLESLMKT
jgi:hypothetical protein